MQWVLRRQNTLTSTTWCCSHHCIVLVFSLCSVGLYDLGFSQSGTMVNVSNVALKFGVRLMSGHWLLLIVLSYLYW